MPKITSVESQKQKTHRFNIYLDGQFAFGADEDLVVEYRLIPGKIIDSTQLEKLLYEAEVGKLMGRMYGLFNIRQRSEGEVRNYFRIKNQEFKIRQKEQIGDLAIESVIKKLKFKGLLNDQEFAKLWVQSRRRSKNKGKLALKQELIQKGINKEIIDIVLNPILVDRDMVSEEQLAYKAIAKKWSIWLLLPNLAKKRKAYGFLSRRGFEYGIIKNVIEKLIKKEYTTEYNSD